jgi:disulfide bond formation protein DsbB
MQQNTSFLMPRSLPWLILAAIATAFGVALLAQYGFGFAPCELCHWQRYAYGLAALIALGGGFVHRSRMLRFSLSLLSLALLSVALIAFFHVGVEYHWWQGTSACGASSTGSSIADITQAIEDAPLTRCDEASFTFLGFSMAFYNMIYAFSLSALSAWGAAKA